jgi:hypothetical protein
LLGATTSRILVDIAGFLMAVYLIRSYLAGVADVVFYAKVLIMSFIMLAVLYSLSTFVSNGTATLIPYAIVGGAILFLCVRGFGLLTEEDKRYLEHSMPSRFGRLMRLLG